MAHQQFEEWLNKLKNVWEKRDPASVVTLCADKFLWFETPFAEPYSTKEQLLKEWQCVLNQEDISVSYEILSVEDTTGIARWNATFTRLPSEEKAFLDGIFQVILDDKGKCTEFHQWYNSKK